MNNIHIFFLSLIIVSALNNICATDIQKPIESAIDQAKEGASRLSKEGQKAAAKLRKRLSKAKKHYEKLLNKLITKNVSRAEREKNKDLIKLKEEIANINQELDELK